MNYYRRWVGDYVRRTAHLSLTEHGVYTVFLDHCYMSGKPLPKDRAAIYRLARAVEQFEKDAVDSVLSQFWSEHDDGWHNKRVDEELAIAQRAISGMSRGGRNKGTKQGTKQGTLEGSLQGSLEGTLQGTHEGTNQGTQTTSNLQPPTSNHQPPAKEDLGASADADSTPEEYPAEFEAIWSIRPPRIGANPKRKAYSAYKAALKRGFTAEQMRAGIERYTSFMRHMRKDNTEFVQRLATFLGPDDHFMQPWSTEGVKVGSKPDNVLFQRGKAFS